MCDGLSYMCDLETQFIRSTSVVRARSCIVVVLAHNEVGIDGCYIRTKHLWFWLIIVILFGIYCDQLIFYFQIERVDGNIMNKT